MATMSTADLLDVFKNMTVLELNDFMKAFEEEFGVTAAARSRSSRRPPKRTPRRRRRSSKSRAPRSNSSNRRSEARAAGIRPLPGSGPGGRIPQNRRESRCHPATPGLSCTEHRGPTARAGGSRFAVTGSRHGDLLC